MGSLNKLEEKFEPIINEIVLPNEAKVCALEESIKEIKKEEIFSAMKEKNGKLYETLKERGAIIKEIYEKRSEIAKINIILLGLDKEKKKEFQKTIAEGVSLDKSLISGMEKEKSENIAKLFSRIGLGICGELKNTNETTIEVSGSRLWVSKDRLNSIEESMKKFNVVSQKIQFLNAQRQIKKFSDEEEKNFSKLQQEYLNGLKIKDELLKEYEIESKGFTVTLQL